MNKRKGIENCITKIMALIMVFSAILIGCYCSVVAQEETYTLAVQGKYIADAQRALNRINAIRQEACKEGIINPCTGVALKISDYVPLQWSAGLEEIARIRAAEASYYMSHKRPNDSSFDTCVASDGTETWCEDLAWNGTENMIMGIEQWYEEKEAWVKQDNTKVTGHYTSMINPEYCSVGLGMFITQDKEDWNTLAGEFSSYPSTNTNALPSGSVIQPISVSKSRVQKFSINGAGSITLVEHAAQNVKIMADVMMQGVYGNDYLLKNTMFLMNSNIQWSSNHPEIVSVDSNGKLYAKKAGTAIIQATPAGGTAISVKVTVTHKVLIDRGVPATCTTAGKTDGSHCAVCGCVITPQKIIPALGHRWNNWKITKKASITTTGSKTRTCNLCGKKETVIIPKLTPTGKTNVTTIILKEKQSTTGLKVTGLAYGDKIQKYISSNKKVFTVSSKGKITAKKKGRAILEIVLKSGKVLKVNVNVQTGKVATTAIFVNATKITMKKGKSYTIKASIAPFTSKEKITYSSSDKKVVSISSKGKIKAKKSGTAIITVRSGSKSVYVTVTVK